MHKNQRVVRLDISDESEVSVVFVNEGFMSESIVVEIPMGLQCEIYGNSTGFHTHDSHSICYMYEGSVLCVGKDCFQFSKDENSIVPITRAEYDAIAEQISIAA